MQQRMTTLTLAIGLALTMASSAAMAQYQLTKLSSNQVGHARHDDPLLVNGWGLVHGPGTPWWISDNNSGWSTLYDGAGNSPFPQMLRAVLIPTAGENGPGSPTGVVFNGNGGFSVAVVKGVPQSALFLFAALDGTISGWAPGANFNQAIAKVTVKGAMFTGLAISNNPNSANFLFAVDMANSKVDIFDSNFTQVNTPNAFTDSAIPAGFTPFGIRDINGIVYVTFASTNGASGGFVEKFFENGTPVTPGKPLIQGATLNQPWGIAIAPSNFGPLSRAVLVGNNTNTGEINAFDPSNGNFIGKVKDTTGQPIIIDQLWGIDFGDGLGKNGQPNQLFFAAGPSNNNAGTLGMIALP